MVVALLEVREVEVPLEVAPQEDPLVEPAIRDHRSEERQNLPLRPLVLGDNYYDLEFITELDIAKDK